MFGWLLLCVLTAGVAFNALGVAIRFKPRGTAELGIVAGVAFYAALAAPVLGLGLAEQLTPLNLALVSSALTAATFYALVRGRSVREHIDECRQAAGRLLALPVRALLEATRARSVVALGLGAAYVIIGYALLFAVLAPVSWWDSAIYHEPIIGFAIQNHGFRAVSLPAAFMTQETNSFPRACEAVSIWFAIFTDRTLTELPNVLAAPALMLTVYAMAQRSGERLTSMGWAVVLALMPQTRSQLARVYVDVQVGFFAVAALYFATQPRIRFRDAACANLALLLFLGAKFSALTLAPPVVLVVFVRLLITHARTRRGAALTAIAISSVGLAGTALLFPLRNWRYFHDPLWPLTYENKLLGLHWKGLVKLDELLKRPPLQAVLEQMYAAPGRGLRDIMDRGYGYAVAWVLFPLTAVAFAVATAVIARELVRTRKLEPDLGWLGWALLVLAAWFLAAPTLTGQEARYNINLVATSAVLATWLLRGPSWLRAREGVMAAAIALSVIPLFWQGDYMWSYGITEEPSELFRHPFAHPGYVTKPTLDLLGKEREAEIGPGDRVAFDDHINFIGLLWNFKFSNLIMYIPFTSDAAYLAAVDAYDPKWVAASGDTAKALLGSHRWELVGNLSGGDQQVYRRSARP
jgi:hypothetical protein